MGFRINTNIAAMNAHGNATMNNIGLDYFNKIRKESNSFLTLF